MTLTDPIADMLTRVRNANSAHHDAVSMPFSKLKSHIAEILQAGVSDADIAPLQHVADAFMLGKRNVVEAFYD